jgi:DNA-binding NtrC family response regulator
MIRRSSALLRAATEKPMYDTIKRLVADMRGTVDLDRCCIALGQALIRAFDVRYGDNRSDRAQIDRDARASPRVLRVTVHVRSDDAYRNFAVTSSSEGRMDRVEIAPSASLWRLVHARAEPFVLDVMVGEIEYPESNRDHSHASQLKELAAPVADSSRTRFSSRDATHVLAVPLLGDASQAFGMVCIEVQHRAGVGIRGLFDDVLTDLRLLVDLAAPQLALGRPRTATALDGVPVIGERTQALYSFLPVFARQRGTMLITGESGTGKSQLARWVHEHSDVRDGPFETFSMHGLNEDMQLAHLFGWRRGAFTGANDAQMGLIEAARGGTLLIDEIDKLSLKAQGGLLNVLESDTYRRLGETRTRPVETRFLIATNVNLRAACAAGAFREDLYYRISVLPVMLPSMDQRRDELPAWIKLMVDRVHAERCPRSTCKIAQEAVALLEQTAWPGNLRQLDNVLRRAYALAISAGDGEEMQITVEDVRTALVLDGASSAPDDSFIDSLAATARAFVQLRLAGAMEGTALHNQMLHGNLLFAMTWAIALQELGEDHDRVAKLIGKETSLRSRNYHKELRREMRKLSALHDVYGKTLPDEVARYLE